MFSSTLTDHLRFVMRLLITASTSSLLAAGLVCADSSGLEKKLARQNYQQGESVDYIYNYELDGWNYVDPNHIVIHTGPSQHYLISLMNSCHDLSTAENIAFTTTTNRLTKFDKLIVRGAGNIKQDCQITQIQTLTKSHPSK